MSRIHESTSPQNIAPPPSDEDVLSAGYRLNTPDQVDVRLSLAGPGSRMMAAAIDVLIKLALIILISIIFMIMSVALTEFQPMQKLIEGDFVDAMLEEVGMWLTAVYIVLLFLIWFGYHLVLEIFMRGRTPGKKTFGLLAISDDGTRLTLWQAIVRNLIRIVDTWVFLPYPIGGVVSFFHPEHRRLGDIAAGTIVIYDQTHKMHSKSVYTTHILTATDHTPNENLSEAERRVLEQFFNRRDMMKQGIRVSFGDQLARAFYDRHAGYWHSPESYLERLYLGKHDEPPEMD